MTKLVLFGWGIEFGRYYCGGAPEGVRPTWIDGFWSPQYQPAVPVSWSYGFGIHYRTYHTDEWGWRRRWWYGVWRLATIENVSSDKQGRAYLDAMFVAWKQ